MMTRGRTYVPRTGQDKVRHRTMTENNKPAVDLIAENVFQIIPLLKKRLSHITAFRSEEGLPFSHYQVLSLLEERGSMSVSEISDYFDIAKPNITPLVDRLVNANLVDRVRSTTDRRVVYVVILDEGRMRLKSIRESLKGNVSAWHENLTDEEFDRLAAAIPAEFDFTFPRTMRYVISSIFVT